MEESSPWHEEERTATFYVYHPCHFLQEALRTLLRCLGIESGTSMSSEAKQERSSLPQTHAAADPTISSPTNTHTTSLGAAGPPSVTDRTISTSLIARSGRRSTVSHGSGPQHD
ncbi:hypothetical protein PHAVU_007G086700 [Phaseolus vulgaris]|uniref:Uncharacterized protein n=1 Tax=Phaseolus vulgaris TaxID=3885 RepID=V7BDG4_PHAVU|nr:hypothetical protein PHAVU_007G086700g [Phaseolus vulgaris]XP_007143617.1 hypothetical protein PHAVU_007G086700g [Phaseolus vulgaris]ESW15610.1 hypothetical protein PHAVU_007G086700g [Phaseolus vulgaris]ESW15611.1 hypothetical protein PHAVU_007G086700g [Phaseolus vulgaris]